MSTDQVVYTRHTIDTAARRILEIFECSGTRGSVGFDAHGEIAYSMGGVHAPLEVAVLGENDGIGYIDPDWSPEDMDAWTDTERDEALRAIVWALGECTDCVEFGCEPEDVDNDKEPDMDEITLKRDNDRDLRFRGKKIAEAASSPNSANRRHESTGRWTELKLYRTAGGKYIATTIGRTQWTTEHDRHAAVVCKDVEAVIVAFGTGWLAKELYDNACIECVEAID